MFFENLIIIRWAWGKQAVVEAVTYDYNLANRLEMVTTTRGDTVEVTEYTYNDDGIRVKSQYSRTVSSVTDQARTIVYLVDSYNHTGYVQTLEEETVTTDYIDGVPQTPVTETTTYLIGDDVIAQTKSNWEFTTQWDQVGDAVTQYLLYDGHGSTRQLAQWFRHRRILGPSEDAISTILWIVIGTPYGDKYSAICGCFFVELARLM